jgi:predicted phage-related endonuclease
MTILINEMETVARTLTEMRIDTMATGIEMIIGTVDLETLAVNMEETATDSETMTDIAADLETAVAPEEASDSEIVTLTEAEYETVSEMVIGTEATGLETVIMSTEAMMIRGEDRDRITTGKDIPQVDHQLSVLGTDFRVSCLTVELTGTYFIFIIIYRD